MPYRAPAVSADGSVSGTAESLLGDEKEDIFHGIVVRSTKAEKALEIPAARIKYRRAHWHERVAELDGRGSSRSQNWDLGAAN